MDTDAVVERRARVRWEGSLRDGRGALSTQSAVLVSMPLAAEGNGATAPEGKTTPEELLAAAVATSYAMTLVDELDRQIDERRALDVEATCTTEGADGDRRLSNIEVRVEIELERESRPGDLPEAVRRAADRCRVLAALTPTVPIRLRFHLEPEGPSREGPADPRDELPGPGEEPAARGRADEFEDADPREA